MAFLNPLVLIGLAAAAIPLIIHLFNFRKPKRIDFSSLAFLRELEKTTMRRVQIKQWLLLLLRTLAIACLVLAFAQPTRTSAWEGVVGERAPSAIALVVDNSMSMTMRDGQGAYLDQAKALSTALASSVQPGDEFFFVPVHEQPDEHQAAFSSDEAVLDAIEELEPRFGSTTALDGIAQAVSLLEAADNARLEMYVISDLQESTFVDSAATVVGEDIQLTLMPLGERDHNNIAVTNTRIESQIIEAGQPVEVLAEVTNFAGASESYGISVYLDGERVAQTAADLEEGEPEEVSLVFTPPRAGWLHGEVRIEADEAEWDDVRHFVLHVPETRRVLVVRGNGARSDLVSIALNVASERGTVQVVGTNESELTGAGVNDYDVVVLVSLADLSSGEEALLEEYVQAGGGLVVFAGEQIEAANGLLGRLGGGGFSGSLGEVGGTSIGGFGRADLEHPLFTGLFDSASGTARIESPEVSFAAAYQAGGGNESTLIHLAGGTPFLQEIRSGQGSALVFSVAPDPTWSDFPIRGLFVPLLYRSVVYAASGNEQDATNAEGDELASIRVSGLSGIEPVRLVGPDGVESIPTQRAVPGGVLLDLGNDVRDPGVYDIAQNNDVLRRVAVNLDPRESNLETLSHDEAVQQLEEATGQPVRLLDAVGGAGLEAAAQLQTEHAGVDLSWIFLAIALACLIGEMFVAMRWKKVA